VLALTVVRIIPVFLAQRGTTITRLEAICVIRHGLAAGPIGAAFAKRSGRARGRDERAGSRDLNGRRGEVAGALRQLRATTGRSAVGAATAGGATGPSNGLRRSRSRNTADDGREDSRLEAVHAYHQSLVAEATRAWGRA
jgi:hypothetical protein